MSIKEVIPNLFIGDIRAAQNLQTLQEKNITHIVQVMGGHTPQFDGKIKYKIIDVADLPEQNVLS